MMARNLIVKFALVGNRSSAARETDMDGALCGGVLGTKDTGVCFEIRLAKVDTGTCSTADPEKSFRPHRAASSHFRPHVT